MPENDYQPLDYADLRRAQHALALEGREINRAYREAVERKARAEAAYRRALAVEVLVAKHEVGATVAETVAKGTAVVADAREELVIAEGMVYAEHQRHEQHMAARSALMQAGSWSRAIDPSSYPS